MSIRLRLTLYWSAITTTILLAAGLLIFFFFSRELWGTLDAALLEEADSTAAALSRGEAAQIVPLLSHLAAEKDLGPGRRVRLIVGGRLVFDQGDKKSELPDAFPANGQALVDGTHHRYRFAVVALTLDRRQAWLQDGVDAGPTRDTVARLRRVLMLAVPLFLVVCVACGYALSAGALRPLIRISDALAEIGPRDLAQRLPTPAVYDESGRLVRAINELLVRLEHASAIQRRFISEAAHELRTPLAVLRSGLEVALQRPRDASESRAAMEEALREVERLCGTAEDLLELARLDAQAARKIETVNLGEVAAGATDAVRPLADVKSQTLALRECQPPALVRGNPDELRRLTLNLLSNAIKFAPSGGHVELSVAASDSVVTLRVADDGPGLESEEIARMFDAFYRGRRAAGGGVGLGLALCREIVRLHGGSISAANRPHGGCEIEVRLPPSTAWRSRSFINIR